MLKSDAIKVADQYARAKGIAINLEKELGGGTDGWVWESYRPSAVKVLEHKSNYNAELICYQRFAAERIQFIRGFRVPRLIDFNDELQIVEMSMVTKPFLLDFAKCSIDKPIDFTDLQMENWNAEGIENFGKDRWKEAKIIHAALKRYGVYYYDIKPGNLMFADWEDDDD